MFTACVCLAFVRKVGNFVSLVYSTLLKINAIEVGHHLDSLQNAIVNPKNWCQSCLLHVRKDNFFTKFRQTALAGNVEFYFKASGGLIFSLFVIHSPNKQQFYWFARKWKDLHSGNRSSVFFLWRARVNEHYSFLNNPTSNYSQILRWVVWEYESGAFTSWGIVWVRWSANFSNRCLSGFKG